MIEQTPKKNNEISPAEIPNAPSPIKKNKRIFTWVICVFLCIMFFLGLATVLYLNQHVLQEKQKLSYKMAQIEEKEVGILKQAEIVSDLKRSQEKLLSKINELEMQLQQELTQKNSQDWVLLKARYYLELAQINSHWSDQEKTTIALLQEADHLLQQVNQGNVFELRQILAKNIAQLKSTPEKDVVGLLSQLDAIQSQVQNLHQSTMINNQNELTQPLLNADKPWAWQNLWQNSLKVLKKMVIIRRNSDELSTIVSPDFENMLKQSMIFNLQQTQWAVLNNNPRVYQLSLKQVMTTLNRYFSVNPRDTLKNQNDATTFSNIEQQLTQLQNINWSRQRPQIDLALPLLDEIIGNKESLFNPTRNEENKGANQP